MIRVATAADAATWLAGQSCSCGARQFAREPVLANDRDIPVLRYGGCTRCMQPPHLDARLPEVIEVAIAGKHALDPTVVGAIAPLVIAGFDEYASGPPEHIDTSAISLGPEWSLVEWLRGSFAFGQARCVRRDGVRAVATFSRPPAAPLARVTEQLKLTAPGVTPILELRQAGEYAVLLEAEPRGLPLATPMFPVTLDVALAVVGKLLDIVRDTAGRGEVLHGLRPELVYVDRDLSVGVVPRAERFATAAPASRDLEAESPFAAFYGGPETLRGNPATAAYDVFSCCAILLFLVTRRPPFPGAGPMQQMVAMMSGPPALPAALDPRTAQLVRAGLDPDPSKRPSAKDLASSIILS